MSRRSRAPARSRTVRFAGGEPWTAASSRAAHYTASPSPNPVRLPKPDYPGHFVGKTITTAGTFHFGRCLVYLADVLTNQRIGMERLWMGGGRSISTRCFPPSSTSPITSFSPDSSVTHVAGHLCCPCSRSFSAGRMKRRNNPLCSGTLTAHRQAGARPVGDRIV